MSVEVLVFALAHAVPVLLVGLLRRGHWKALHTAAVVMGVGAVLTGADVFLVVDLLFIAGAWLVVLQKWRTQGL